METCKFSPEYYEVQEAITSPHDTCITRNKLASKCPTPRISRSNTFQNCALWCENHNSAPLKGGPGAALYRIAPNLSHLAAAGINFVPCSIIANLADCVADLVKFDVVNLQRKKIGECAFVRARAAARKKVYCDCRW